MRPATGLRKGGGGEGSVHALRAGFGDTAAAMRRPVLAALLTPLLWLCACGERAPDDPLARIRSRGALVVATEAEFKPFEYVTPTGEIVGFDVDLVRALAEDLGVTLVLRNVRFESIVAELATGKVDLIASGMTVTPERAKSVLFSEPYFFTKTCLLVSSKRRDDVRSIADLNRPERVLAVKESTTGATTAALRCPKARIVSHKTENAAALDVAEGRADAFLYDLSSVREHQRQHPDATFLLEEPVTYEPYALAVRPDEPALKARVDALLRALRADGRLEAIFRRHAPEGSLEAR